MKKLLIVGNLKSYETEKDAKTWLESFKSIKELNLEDLQKQVIICPPFTLLDLFKTFIAENNLSVALGAQDVSPFDEGAYTGEVNAKQVREFCQYVLIGHSERRRNFNETDEVLIKKTQKALEYGLEPIFLIQGVETVIPEGVKIIAYEPVFAIGSGSPDSPENADSVALSVKSKANGHSNILYGGSVISENVNKFTQQQNINGVLVGGASLNPNEFIEIIKNA